MPRQDINDNRSLRNLQGIDLRKNAESNSAEDMVNVWLDSQHHFTNRPMPDLYSADNVTYSNPYKFACECKNLAGSEVEIDISSAEGVPSVSDVQEATDDSGEIWIIGSNLETVREALWVSPSGGVLIGGTDFSFYYDRENDRLVIQYQEGKEGLDTSAYEYFVLISPYGQVSTQYAGQVSDYCFGHYGEYRVRTYLFGGSSYMSIEAKQANGNYKQMMVWHDSEIQTSGEKKHYTLGGILTLYFYYRNARLRVDYSDEADPKLHLEFYANGQWQNAFTVSGGKPFGETYESSDPYPAISGDWNIGQDDRFKFTMSNLGIDIKEKDGNNYKTVTRFE